jgi:hypothetical protein
MMTLTPFSVSEELERFYDDAAYERKNLKLLLTFQPDPLQLDSIQSNFIVTEPKPKFSPKRAKITRRGTSSGQDLF